MLSALGDIKVYTFIRTTYNKKYEKQNLSVDHWHDFYQLVYARKGNGAVIIDGEELPLSENDVVLIAPGQRHFFKAYSEKFKTYEVKFSLLSVENLQIIKNGCRCTDGMGYIKKSLKQIEHEADLIDPFSYNIVLLEILKILELIKREHGMLCDNGTQISEDYDDLQDEFFNKINTYIDKNISSNITVMDISKEFHMEYKYFSRLFTQKYGIRLKQYINRKRLERAKNMIVNTELSMTEIAVKCGFESLHRMGRVFKSEEKTSPSDYRYRFKHSYSVDFNVAPKNPR